MSNVLQGNQGARNPSWAVWAPLLGLVLPVWMAVSFSCHVPRVDDWGLVVLPYLRWVDGGSFGAFLSAAGNDSRHDAPQLLHWLVIRLADWHPVVESMICVLLGGLAAGMLLWLWSRHPGGWRVRAGYGWLSAIGLLSPMQWMNWTWGIQICYMLVVAATLGVVVLLSGDGPLWRRTLLAIPCLWVAVFSFVNGWLAFGLGVLMMAGNWFGGGLREKDRGGLAAVLWVLAGLGAGVVYGWGMRWGAAEASGQGTDFSARAHDLAVGARFFMEVLGAPFGEWTLTAERANRVAMQSAGAWVVSVVSLGLFGACLAGIWRRRAAEWRAALPWLALAMWGLGNALAITVARSGEGGYGPFHSRYPAFTMWFFAGLFGLLHWLPARASSGALRWTVRVWLGVLIWGSLAGGVQGWRDAERLARNGDMMEAAAALRRVAVEPVYLDASWPGVGERVSRTMDRLDELGLLKVRTVKSEAVADATFSESPLGVGELRSGRVVAGGVELEGWAMAAEGRGPVKAVVLSCESEGGGEIWLGLATRNKVLHAKAKKERARVPEDRIGWVYEPLTGQERSFLRGRPLMMSRKPLPAGRVKFRAYAFDPVSGLFSPLPGEVALTLPSTDANSTDP